MKFKFPLQKVLDHRIVMQNIAQKDFQDAQAILLEQEGVLRKMIGDLKEAREEAGALALKTAPDAPGRWKQIHEFTILQDRRIEMQRAKVRDAEKLVEDKRDILRQKAIDSKMMERLKERRREQFIEEMKATEQKDVDELNILRFESKDGE
ncbi:MAG: flagellar export protein FliJ [Bdellovibrionaceae bacterium]|nr:flagellar export protein FliJ [Pseudobdellovibrionaceae bacterium]